MTLKMNVEFEDGQKPRCRNEYIKNSIVEDDADVIFYYPILVSFFYRDCQIKCNTMYVSLFRS